MSTVPAQVLEAYGFVAAALTPISIGHINRTFLVEHGAARFVLQRLNPIFGPEIHDDIDAVTRHLERLGHPTPRLVPSAEGALFALDADAGVWRVLTHVEGETHDKAASPGMCHAAGALLGRFHAALTALEHAFKNRRKNIHDTPRHLQGLRDALSQHGGHALLARVEPLAMDILREAEGLPALDGAPPRKVHGDPKLSNILFAHAAEARCMVDLDTLGVMSVPVELGDALRSWCNPAREDETASRIDLAFFEAALVGYGETARAFLTPAEVELIPAGVQTIALELAARFCADALNESYFGWDRARFERAGEHHLARAQSQLALARSVAAQRGEAERVVRRLL